MSRAMKSVWEFVYVVFAVMAMISAGAYAAISCMTVDSDIMQCTAFVSGANAEPSKACCDGIKSLNSAASTTDDRKAACKCIKSLIGGAPINYTRAAELPNRCSVDIGIPITPPSTAPRSPKLPDHSWPLTEPPRVFQLI